MRFSLAPVLLGSPTISPATRFPLLVLRITLASKVCSAPKLSSHFLSSLSSDSIVLKYLNAESFQIYISSSDLSSELQMHTSNYLLNIFSGKPDRFLKLKSKLSCHLSHFTAILSFPVVQAKNPEITLDSCFFSYSLSNSL